MFDPLRAVSSAIFSNRICSMRVGNPTNLGRFDWSFNFHNFETDTYGEDAYLTCRSTPSSSSCSVTVSLSGLAKEIQGKCEGEYKDTGLRCRGRQVTFRSIKSFAHFKQLIGVQTGQLP